MSKSPSYSDLAVWTEAALAAAVAACEVLGIDPAADPDAPFNFGLADLFEVDTQG